MAAVYQFSEVEMLAFILVLLRVSSFVVAWPVFGVATVPSYAKILFALAISIVLFPVVAWKSLDANILSNTIAWLALKEVFIGLCLGFFARLFFFAISIGGQIIGMSMGLSGAQILNPSLGSRGSAVEQFQIVLATFFFLALNGHHLFLAGLVQSFDIIPLKVMTLSMAGFENIGGVAQEIMVMGVKICSPVLVAILFLNLSMGIVGRVVPQINVLITSLPINILAGFLVLILTVPLLVSEMEDIMSVMALHMFKIMKTF